MIFSILWKIFISFISALIFFISFLLLTLGFICSFSSSFFKSLYPIYYFNSSRIWVIWIVLWDSLTTEIYLYSIFYIKYRIHSRLNSSKYLLFSTKLLTLVLLGVRLDCWKFFLFPEVSMYHYKLPHYKFIWFWQISKWVWPRLCSNYSLRVGSQCLRLACTLWCWFLPVLWLSCKQAPLVITATHAGGSSSQCRFSLLGSLRWSLGPSLLGKKPLQLWLSSHFWVATLEGGSWSYGISNPSYRSSCALFFISLFVENLFC